jgi:hypothetical protein
MSMREKYAKGLGVRLPGNQWIYQGTVYDVPAKGIVFKRAKASKGHTGHVIKANPRQLRAMMANGTIPAPR